MTKRSIISSPIPIACATHEWLEDEFFAKVEAVSAGAVAVAAADSSNECAYLIEQLITRFGDQGRQFQVIELPPEDPTLVSELLRGDCEQPLRFLRGANERILVVRNAHLAPDWYFAEFVDSLTWLAYREQTRVFLAPLRGMGAPSEGGGRICRIEIPTWSEASTEARKAVLDQICKSLCREMDFDADKVRHVANRVRDELDDFSSRSALETAIRDQIYLSPGKPVLSCPTSLLPREELARTYESVIGAIELANKKFFDYFGYLLVEDHHHRIEPFKAGDLWHTYHLMITSFYVRMIDYPAKQGLYKVATQYSASEDGTRMVATKCKHLTEFIELIQTLRTWVQHGLDPVDKDNKQMFAAVKRWHLGVIGDEIEAQRHGRRLCQELLSRATAFERALRALSVAPVDDIAKSEFKINFQRWKRDPSDHWIGEEIGRVIRENKLTLCPQRVCGICKNEIRGWIKKATLDDAQFKQSLVEFIKNQVNKQLELQQHRDS